MSRVLEGVFSSQASLIDMSRLDNVPGLVKLSYLLIK